MARRYARSAPIAPAPAPRGTFDAPLRSSRRLTIAEYEELRRGDGSADRRKAPKASALGRDALDRGLSFLGVDEGERPVYGTA